MNRATYASPEVLKSARQKRLNSHSEALRKVLRSPRYHCSAYRNLEIHKMLKKVTVCAVSDPLQYEKLHSGPQMRANHRSGPLRSARVVGLGSPLRRSLKK